MLEDGYNTDYIYSLLVALFYSSSENVNFLLNIDTSDPNVYYVQEFIKLKFAYKIQHNVSIDAPIVNKFRIFIHHCGWLNNTDIMGEPNINDLYLFLFSGMMGYNIEFTLNENKVIDTIKFPYIHITNATINGIPGMNDKIINLSDTINKWINQNVTYNKKYKCHFREIPRLLAIFVDIKSEQTKENIKLINIMFSIQINDISCDATWNVHSLICQDKNKLHYAITYSDNKWIAFSDKVKPSNSVIDMAHIPTVNKIMKEVVFVFYALQ